MRFLPWAGDEIQRRTPRPSLPTKSIRARRHSCVPVVPVRPYAEGPSEERCEPTGGSTGVKICPGVVGKWNSQITPFVRAKLLGHFCGPKHWTIHPRVPDKM